MADLAPVKIRNSFDVFDTCLTRLWANPSDSFLLLGQQLQALALIGPQIADFTTRRQAAEVVAWQQGQYKKQPSMQKIYAHLALDLGWTDEQSGRALETEQELEVETLKSVPQMLALVTRIHDAGESVVFISDMYLPNEVILRMLRQNGFWRPGDQLFVSAEAGCGKHNGRLFRHVRRALARPPFAIKHTGDNYRSDYVMAWLSGFRGRHFRPGLLHERERATLQPLGNVPLGSRLAALSRLTRVSFTGPDSQRGLWDAVVTGFAPLMFSFAFHCLLQAREQGLADLFFCSRDGSLPMQVARIINQAYGFGLNIHYFRCSRSAWCKTNLTGPNPQGLAAALENSKNLTVRAIRERLDLAEADQAVLQAFVGGNMGTDTPLSKRQKEALLQGFAAGLLHEQLAAVEEKTRWTCRQYFAQCGMNSGRGFLLVDGFSRGTIEFLYDGIVAPAVNRAVWVYLKFLNPERQNPTNSYLPPDQGKFPFSKIALAEALLATNEPSLIAYRCAGTDVSLEFGPAEVSLEKRQRCDLVHQACTTFAQLTAEHLLLGETDKTILDLYATTAFNSLASNPTRAEANELRKLPFEYWSGKTELARRPGLRDLAKSARYRFQPNAGQLILDGPWMAGSLALADPVSRSLLRLLMRG